MKYKLLIVSILALLTIGIFIYTSGLSPDLAASKHKVELALIPDISEIIPGVDPSLYRPSVIGSISEYENINTYGLLGFEGPYYLSSVDGDTVEVIRESIFTNSRLEYWNAKGLIRNQTLSPVSNLSVIAKLYDHKGKILTTIKNKVALEFVRSGEPAPFQIDSHIDYESVGKVEWVVEYDNAPDDTYSRNIILYTHWIMQYGQTHYKGFERDDSTTFPYVLSTGFQNMGDHVNEAGIIVAWLNSENQVIYIIQETLDKSFTKGIGQHGTGHFNNIIIEQPDTALMLNESEFMYWGIGK